MTENYRLVFTKIREDREFKRVKRMGQWIEAVDDEGVAHFFNRDYIFEIIEPVEMRPDVKGGEELLATE